MHGPDCGAADPRGRDAHIYDEAIKFIEQHKDGPFYVNVWGHIPHNPVNPVEPLVKRWNGLKVKDGDFPPQMLAKVGRDLRPCLRRGQLVLSIMAGKTLGFLQAGLPKAAIVRAMPNTPAAIGRGITVAVPNAAVTAEQKGRNG